jgi:predicted amidohydrolase YtcJ
MGYPSRAGAGLATAALLILAGCNSDRTDTAPGPEASLPTADLLLRNAYVYTVDGKGTVAEAVAIDEGVIVYVGDDDGAMVFAGDATEIRDMDGMMILPGLHDMHIHAFGIIESDGCDLDSRELSLQDLVPVLKACISDEALPAGEWLIVQQWSFAGGNEPSDALPNIRAALDAVSLEHPIFLYGDDGHHGAANSAAFALAEGPDGNIVPMNAESLKDAFASYRPLIEVNAVGEPTGGIHEDARALLRPDRFTDRLGGAGELADKVGRVGEVLAAKGITTIQEAATTADMVEAFGRHELAGDMSFRVRAALIEPPQATTATIGEHVQDMIALRERYAGYRYVRADAAKLFADAVLEGNPLSDPPVLPVAAVLDGFRQPMFRGRLDDGSFELVGYVDQDSAICRSVRNDGASLDSAEAIEAFRREFGFYPQQCLPASGDLEHDEAFIRAYIRAATQAGFHVHVHALSDRAVRVAVDEFARVKGTADRLNVTQSLAHLQLVHPDDQKRMGELGIAGVFTFAWARPEPAYEMMVRPFIDELDNLGELFSPGGYYMDNVYPARSLQEYGAPVVHGSDAPVDTRDPRPFENLLQSIYRSNGEAVMNADQRLDIDSAIRAFTINGARLFGHADRLGSIEVGKIADLVAIDRNLVTLANSPDIEDIAGTQVMLTVFEGRVIYERTAGASGTPEAE